MRFVSTIVAAFLSLAAGSHAWAQDDRGVWIANNQFYDIRGAWVHESCTHMNTLDVLQPGEFCAFWIDGAGRKYEGRCNKDIPGQTLCLP
ncbi:hypothetical protein N657DRAFT_594627 [Parathielavia appendiculata]|uniref:Secreted protein n=1 Tax=Parathielavia appendiculata TaxID=2587402 RepID=A0AAN6U0E2_9PEZI|nr:hypothetical protein N657DRAFT_594627 [Parathielavia appendiculata]